MRTFFDRSACTSTFLDHTEFVADQNALLADAFAYFLDAFELEQLGDKVAQDRGLVVADQRIKFEAMYYEGCEETSMNAAVYGAYHDAARDEECGWDALERLDGQNGLPFCALAALA